jgi:hypothetical protein
VHFKDESVRVGIGLGSVKQTEHRFSNKSPSVTKTEQLMEAGRENETGGFADAELCGKELRVYAAAEFELESSTLPLHDDSRPSWPAAILSS